MPGYDHTFLGSGFMVKLPMLTDQLRAQALNNGHVFDFHHFSLVMHARRKFAIYVAHNVDRTSIQTGLPRARWYKDPGIGFENQAGNEVYRNNPWDKGHLARKMAVAWGERDEAIKASNDSFCYANASLQHHYFNTDEWLKLEDWVIEETDAQHLCVFTGPVNRETDRTYRGVQIPAAFWKVVAFMKHDRLQCRAFMMKQDEFWDDENGADLINLTSYQVSLTEISELTGLMFQRDLYDTNPIFFHDSTDTRNMDIEPPERRPISGPGDLIGERGAFTNIYQTLWDMDSNGLTVTRPNETGGWVDPEADIRLLEVVNGRGGQDSADMMLFQHVNEAKLEQGTYPAFRTLVDNYDPVEGRPESYSSEEREEIDTFVHRCFYEDDGHTPRPLMKMAYDYITSSRTDGGLAFEKSIHEDRQFSTSTFSTEPAFIDLSDYDHFMNTVREIWFGIFDNHRGETDHHCTAFEHVFIGEITPGSQRSKVGGYHFWYKFFLDERSLANTDMKVDYMGTMYKLKNGNEQQGVLNTDVATLVMSWQEGNITKMKEQGGFFVGISPELIMAMGNVALFEHLRHKQEPDARFDDRDYRYVAINGWKYKLAVWRETLSGGRGNGLHFRSFWPGLLGKDGGTVLTGQHEGPVKEVEVAIGPLLISALLPNPEGAGDIDEWLEVTNVSTETLNSEDFQLGKSTPQRPLSFNNFELAPGQSRRIFVRQGSEPLALSNKGTAVSLYHEGEVISRVGYGKVGGKHEGVVLNFPITLN